VSESRLVFSHPFERGFERTIPPVSSESMPIPPLTGAGLLPEGVHECTLDDIRERFGLFQRMDRRPVLFSRLIEFLKEARESAMVEAVCVDGSFVTAADIPNDIDLILVVRKDFNLAVDLLPAQYNLISRAHVQRRFGFDIVAVRSGSPEVDEAVSFFQQVRGRPDDRKGILRIII
jgi:hypothetical protein